MGWLAEKANASSLQSFIAFAKIEVNPKYNVFDPAGEEEGEFVNEWRLQLNISRAQIESIIEKAENV